MELNEPLMETAHPPHPGEKRKYGPYFLRLILKSVLFLAIFVLSFHISHYSPESFNREQSIQEIYVVLDRHRTGLAEITKMELAEVIYEEAVRHNHDPKFIMALIFAESEFFNWAVSERGAKGLMQIMPYVGELLAQEIGIEWMGDHTLFNPYLNIKMGIHFFSKLISDFKDPRVALTAYNYGPTYVRDLIDKKRQIPDDFYRRILTVYQSI